MRNAQCDTTRSALFLAKSVSVSINFPLEYHYNAHIWKEGRDILFRLLSFEVLEQNKNSIQNGFV